LRDLRRSSDLLGRKITGGPCCRLELFLTAAVVF
jgi:hypothetical protein